MQLELALFLSHDKFSQEGRGPKIKLQLRNEQWNQVPNMVYQDPRIHKKQT